MPWQQGVTPHNGSHVDRSFNDRATLHDLYVDQGLTSTDIAKMAHTDRHTITRWLRRHGIQVRSGREFPAGTVVGGQS